MSHTIYLFSPQRNLKNKSNGQIQSHSVIQAGSLAVSRLMDTGAGVHEHRCAHFSSRTESTLLLCPTVKEYDNHLQKSTTPNSPHGVCIDCRREFCADPQTKRSFQAWGPLKKIPRLSLRSNILLFQVHIINNGRAAKTKTPYLPYMSLHIFYNQNIPSPGVATTIP